MDPDGVPQQHQEHSQFGVPENRHEAVKDATTLPRHDSANQELDKREGWLFVRGVNGGDSVAFAVALRREQISPPSANKLQRSWERVKLGSGEKLICRE